MASFITSIQLHLIELSSPAPLVFSMSSLLYPRSRHQESNTWLLLEWMSVAFCRHPIHLHQQCFYLERNGLHVCPLMEFPVGDFVWPLDSQKPPEIIYLKNFQHLVYAFGDPSMILLYIVTYSRCCRSEHVNARKSTKVVSYI